MKKTKFLAILGLTTLTLLTSCGSDIEISIGLGDGSVPDDGIRLHFGLNNTIEEGFAIEGYLTAEKDAVIKDEYVFTYAHTDPLFGDDTYIETTLFTWKKDQILATKNGDAYGNVEFKAELNLESVFPKDLEDKIVYFVLHASIWDKNNITEVGSTDYSYTWSGDKVNIKKA